LGNFQIKLISDTFAAMQFKTFYTAFGIIFLALFSACTSEADQKAMTAMADLFHAERIAIGSEKGIGSLKGNFKTLTIKGGDVLNNSAIADENITAMGALAFMDVWAADNQKEYAGFKIKLERSINGQLKKVEAAYAIDTLNMVKTNMQACIKAGNAMVSKEYTILYNQLYFDIKAQLSAEKFSQEMRQIDSAYGGISAFKVTNFSTYSATQNDGSELPIVNYTMEVQRDSLISNIRFKYHLLKKEAGLLDLNIEE